MKIAIISKKKPWWFIGNWNKKCRAYHVGFYSDTSFYFYDNNIINRRIPFKDFFNVKTMIVHMFNCSVPENYLIKNITRKKVAILSRKLISKKAKQVRNSVMVNNALRKYKTSIPAGDRIPTPCDILNWYRKIHGSI